MKISKSISLIFLIVLFTIVVQSAYGKIYYSEEDGWELPHTSPQQSVDEFSETFTWFKNKVDFPISDGISRKSRDSVLEGLQNIGFLLKDIVPEDFPVDKRPEIKILQSLYKMSQDYLNIFSSSRNLEEEDYWNLYQDYQGILKTASTCCHETLYSNEIIKDFIAKENQVATPLHVVLVGAAIFTFGVAVITFGILAAKDESRLMEIEQYQIQLAACEAGNKIPKLFSDSELQNIEILCREGGSSLKSKQKMCEVRRAFMNCSN